MKAKVQGIYDYERSISLLTHPVRLVYIVYSIHVSPSSQFFKEYYNNIMNIGLSCYFCSDLLHKSIRSSHTAIYGMHPGTCICTSQLLVLTLFTHVCTHSVLDFIDGDTAWQQNLREVNNCRDWLVKMIIFWNSKNYLQEQGTYKDNRILPQDGVSSEAPFSPQCLEYHIWSKSPHLLHACYQNTIFFCRIKNPPRLWDFLWFHF